MIVYTINSKIISNGTKVQSGHGNDGWQWLIIRGLLMFIGWLRLRAASYVHRIWSTLTAHGHWRQEAMTVPSSSQSPPHGVRQVQPWIIGFVRITRANQWPLMWLPTCSNIDHREPIIKLIHISHWLMVNNQVLDSDEYIWTLFSHSHHQ